MTIFKTAKTPSEQFSDLVTREISLTHERDMIASRIAGAEVAAAEAYLADEAEAVGPEVDLILKLQSQVFAIDRAIVLLRRNRPALILKESQFEAVRIRGEAGQKAKELGVLMDRTKKLLGQLTELQEVPYSPEILMVQLAAPEYYLPKFKRIEAEIMALETKAANLESQNEHNIPESGTVDIESATSSNEVLMAVLQHRAMGPSAGTILAFLQAVEAAAKESRNVEFGDLPRRVRIVWDRSGITSESYVYVAGLAKPKASPLAPVDGLMPSGGFDIASGTFRAPAKEWQAA